MRIEDCAASRRGKGLHSRRLLGTVSALAFGAILSGALIDTAHAVECVTGINVEDDPINNLINPQRDDVVTGISTNSATGIRGPYITIPDSVPFIGGLSGLLGVTVIAATYTPVILQNYVTSVLPNVDSNGVFADDIEVVDVITSVTPEYSGATSGGATDTACGTLARATGGNASAFGNEANANGPNSPWRPIRRNRCKHDGARIRCAGYCRGCNSGWIRCGCVR